MDDDWYQILGVASTASTEEVKKAFRKKALESHPDRNPGDQEAEANFKKIAEAYKILSDPETRRVYDRRQSATSFLAEKFSMTSAAASAASVVSDILDEKIFDKIFERVPEKKNIEVKIQVTLEELYSGADREVVFKRDETCEACRGRGAQRREDFRVCGSCYGLGTSPTIASLFKKKSCQVCRGAGRIILNKCSECSGQGLSKKEIQLIIPIPKDLSLNDRLIVPEEGQGGGNLIIQVETLSHPYFEVRENNLWVEIPISFYQAILGDYLQIETLKGPASFKVEEGSKDGEIVVLRGYGLKKGDSYGDLMIKLLVSLPTRVTLEQRQLLEKYRETEVKKGVKPKKRSPAS